MGRAYQLELSDPTVTYFLDHFTHARVVRAMDRLGMIQDLHGQMFNLAASAHDNALALTGEFLPAHPQDAAAATLHGVLTASIPNPAGIPRHKLATGENWLIAPAEITAALAAHQRAPHDERAAVSALIDEWDPWIDFLHTAGDHAGLRSN
ncbi:hypothetical protein AB0E96_00450 [Kitasatospora sp. NPDC036755]|uniref:hypothetical protein n=1 Tax=Kitasatospora sp. NPDC036755 TaxID=3154600 RepID=UPI0033EEA3DF